MQILFSTNTNPELNAAFEELLFRGTDCQEAIAFIYLNQPAVMIGRNQNPWAECNLDYCARHHIKILRRISGGGAVYHDLHNLNVALILPRKAYAPETMTAIVIRALQRIRVPEINHNDHYSVFSGKRKLCGTAFAIAGKKALLHACLLVRTDLECLRQALQIPADQHITGTAVGSNRMPVTRIADLVPGASVTDVATEVVRAIRRRYHRLSIATVTPGKIPQVQARFAEYLRKFRDPNWTYGHTNDFILEKTIPCGYLKLTIASGFVSHAMLYKMNGESSCVMTMTGRPLASISGNLGHYVGSC